MGNYNIVSQSSLVAGQPEDISVVLANFQAIQAVLNGGLDNTNVNAAAALAVSKFAQGAAGQVLKGVGPAYGQIADAEVAAAAAINVAKLAAGANGQYLQVIGGVPVWGAGPAAGGSLDRVTGNVGPSNTVAETSVYSFAIPGGTLGTDGLVVVDILGDLMASTGGAATFTLKVKWGGTTFFQGSSAGLGSLAFRRGWRIRVYLAAKGATNAQKIIAEVAAPTTTGAAPTTGIGSMDVGVNLGVVGSSPAAEPAIDSTVNQTIDVTLTLSVANANFDMTRRYAITRKVS